MSAFAPVSEKKAESGMGGRPVVFGCPEGQDSRVLIARARADMAQDRIVVHIARDELRMAMLSELIGFFAPDVACVSFPAWDCLPYDRVSPHPDVVARRVAALGTVLGWSCVRERAPRIVLTTVNAVLQRIIPRAALQDSCFTVRTGATLNVDGLVQALSRAGYARSDTVRDAGEFALRGGIIDLFPPDYPEPLRVDLFGDQIESIRPFDPVTQRTQANGAPRKSAEFVLRPMTEFVLDEDSISRFRAGYRAAFGTVRENDPLYESVSQGRKYNGMDHWQPLFFERMETLFDYLPSARVSLDDQALQVAQARWSQIQDFWQARHTLEAAARAGKKKSSDVSLSGAAYHPLPVDRLYLSESEWEECTARADVFSPFAPPDPGGVFEDGGGRKGRDFADIRALPDGDVFKALKAHIAQQCPPHAKTLIATYSEGSSARLRAMMTHAGFAEPVTCADAKAVKSLPAGRTGFVPLALDHGFTTPDLMLLTEQDILGDKLARRQKKRRRSEAFLSEISALSEGDLVVHVDHGVGRFLGLESVRAGKTVHDCLKIEYAGGDKLYVPVENMDILSRFGADEGHVPLDKLGGAAWQARKAKVRKDLLAMAGQLLGIAAERLLKKGQVYAVDPSVRDSFAARFPWQETEDQERAIADVLADLEKEHPMDRLICGDVGFGKTEIALRAAHAVAINGGQVAVVVPTTLLARQHFQTFSARFAGTGIRVEQISRLVSPAQAQKTREGLADGTVPIVVGTHAVLAGSIRFANLGLLIVDEEQRFGVKQKERMKALRADVHVLTLTATPIPRTLQMALAGVREMSLIASPPVDRLAIRTFVLPFDPVVVREAILREKYRGGQSFYVCPRIKDLQAVEETLRDIVPEVRLISAHGQMSATDLEDRMGAFCEGGYDVLLATNIIESGIDIPTANTLIVHRADLFGLAQLYQIRGRIGRARLRAHAYLTIDPARPLTRQAQRRLEVIETLDTLGAGFQLASHDMDIRGAGNLLGEEQSGHVREVGVELYQQMLEEAVASARDGSGGDGEARSGGSALSGQWSPAINLGLSVLIPEAYVSDLTVRMSLYRRLSALETPDDIESFAAELIDRFGALPEDVETLLKIVEIKQLCRKAGIDRLDAGPKGAVLGFRGDSPPDPEKIVRWMATKKAIVKLRPDQKIAIVRPWDTSAARLQGVRTVLQDMAA